MAHLFGMFLTVTSKALIFLETKMPDATKKLKQQLTTKPKPPVEFNLKDGLSTGSALLNLACSGNPSVGFPCGFYYLLVGDSQAGKTFITMSALAEASINPKFHSLSL